MSILLLDNFDSFTYNLYHLLEKHTDEEIVVKRNNEISIHEINNFSAIVLSPGPGLPKDAGIMPEVLHQFSNHKKILGVCLGMQAIGEFYGATLKNLNKVVHGEATDIKIVAESKLFYDCPMQFKVGRYHSWVIDKKTLPSEMLLIAEDLENEVMAIQHNQLPIYGVQFHPESILSEYGDFIIKNWLNA
jgi:anthranilate synthase component 2